MHKKILQTPTRPFVPAPGMSCSDALEALEGCSFQGRQLARAAKVWTEALDEDVTVWLGLAGAMVPAGMRTVVSTLLEEDLVDVVVSTGANLYHDFFETLGHAHYIGSPNVDDCKLRDQKIDRVYDTFADEELFFDVDKIIGKWAHETLEDRPYTTREFLQLLGEEAERRSSGDHGILSTAARLGKPIYCPAIGDSSIGIGLAEKGRKPVLFDMIEDVRETASLAAEKTSLVIYVGGGTPKNFIQQTEVTNIVGGIDVEGHKYAIQFVVDAPQWGGLSGCTFEEAISWGKIAVDASMVTVLCDATIALPIVTTAVMTRRESKRRPGR